jgi:ribosomal protein S18 acetylase RimI-like enzyme
VTCHSVATAPRIALVDTKKAGSGEEVLTFRSATLSDLPHIVRLLADDELGATRENVSITVQQAYLSAFRAIEDDPNQLFLVCLADATIVGCLQLSFIPGLSHLGAWRCQIESVRIAPASRGRGMGRGMMLHAIELANRRGCRIVQLSTDKRRREAHRFYVDLGFVASHEGMRLFLS